MKKLVTVTLVAGLLAGGAAYAETQEVPAGQEVKLEGVILVAETGGFQLRTHSGPTYQVQVLPSTKIVERKTNFLRQADRFPASSLVQGLNVRVEGRGDTSGSILAERVRFTRDELRIARTFAHGTEPLDRRLTETRELLDSTRDELARTDTQLGERADQVEGQVDELESGFRTVRSEIGDIRRSSDQALAKSLAVEQRLADLDHYVEVESQVLKFGFDSAALSDEAKEALAGMVKNLEGQSGYLIEVVGHASPEGNAAYNQRLSARRAAAVVDHLVRRHDVPLRRIVQPFGFGAERTVSDSADPEGRRLNRRVEIRVYQSQGLSPGGMESAAYRPLTARETSQ